MGDLHEGKKKREKKMEKIMHSIEFRFKWEKVLQALC